MVCLDRNETSDALVTSAVSCSDRKVAALARYPQLSMKQLFRQPFPSWSGIDRSVIGPQDIPLESSAEATLPGGIRISMHRENGHVAIIACDARGNQIKEVYVPSAHACIGDVIFSAKDKLRDLMRGDADH